MCTGAARSRCLSQVRTPWVIVSSHRPLYCGEVSGPDYTNGLYHAAILDTVFRQHGVNLYVAGHYHSYERTCPVRDGVCLGDWSQPRAVAHVTVGTAGIATDLGDWSDPPWSVLHVDPAYGYGWLTVANATALRWRYVNVTLEGVETVLDDAWLHQLDLSRDTGSAPEARDRQK